jgi:GT2 family glycosyltransferase
VVNIWHDADSVKSIQTGVERMERRSQLPNDGMIATFSDDESQPHGTLAALCDPALDPLFWNNALAGLPSAWHGHVPFAHWLVQALRPRIIVELGTHNGISYAAFCESVLQSQLTTRCYAVDTWKGDSHAGSYGEEVFRDFRRFHDSRYSGFSELLRTTFAEALPYFAEGSIDLLHIDGLHTYEAVSLDYKQWLPKLSDRSVVLFHDTNVREGNFGVWHLWEELSKAYPSFEFLHGHGLGLLRVGNHAPAVVAALCAISDPPNVSRVRERFATLGQRHVIEFRSIEALEGLRREAEIAQQNLQAAAVSERSRVLDRAIRIATARAKHAEARTRCAEARAKCADAEKDHLLADFDAERRHLLADLDAERCHLLAEKSALARDLEAAKRIVDQQQANIDAVVASTSWRLTIPVRAVGRMLSLQRKRVGLAARAIVPSGGEARSTIARSLRRRFSRPSLAPPLSLAAVATSITRPSLAPPLSLTTVATPVTKETSQYKLWAARFDELRIADRAAIRDHIIAGELPEIFVIAIFNAISRERADTWINALRRQLFDRWQAVLYFSGECSPEVVQHVKDETAEEGRVAVVIAPLDEPDRQLLAKLGHQDRILIVSGEALLREHTLYYFALAATRSPNARLLYADEDCLEAGERSTPWFKPDFSPELLRHTSYLGDCVLLQSWQYDLCGTIERLIAAAGTVQFTSDLARTLAVREVVHVPTILHHAVVQPRNIPPLPGPADLREDDLPTVSIIIPTKDQSLLLEACLTSIWKTAYPSDRLEIIVVDNNTSEPTALRFLSAAETAGRIRLVRDRLPFNYSRVNNQAAALAVGEILVFLNNDTEVNRQDWLRRLVNYVVRPDIGVVGAKLIYPDHTIQHGGIVLGIQGVAAHAFVGLGENDEGYKDLSRHSREISAVTGACMAMRRDVFQELGGFDETLSVAFSDVLICMEAVTHGYRNIVIAEPIVIHHESKTRGFDDTPSKVAIFRHEAEYARSRCPALFKSDPYYNRNLSLERPYEVAWPPRIRKPWRSFALKKGAPLRVLMLSLTHEFGHGVAVVLHQQAVNLAKRHFEVFIGGPMGGNEFSYEGCHRVYLDDPASAAVFAIEHDIDCVVAHTPPFFATLRWLGDWPRTVIYDYGEPDPGFFPDFDQRQNIVAEKRFCYHLADRVFAISRSVQKETRYPAAGVIRLGNSHLATWNETTAARRIAARDALGTGDKIIVLNVCRFYRTERLYKGIDAYIEVMEDFDLLRPDLRDRVVFALSGKATDEDVHEMEACGLRVFPNPSDSEMVDLYAAADVYMNFSRWEGYNLGIGQALALGLPVIASDIPAHREFPIITSSDPLENAHRLATIADELLPVKTPTVRDPIIYDWEEPLAEFASMISELCRE